MWPFSPRTTKARQDESGQGSWEVIIGTVADAGSTDLWERFSTAKKEMIYGRHPTVRACVNVYSSAFRNATLQIGRWESQTEFVVDESLAAKRWLTLMEQGTLDLKYTHDFSASDFWNFLVTRKLLTSKAYLLKLRNPRSSDVVELWPVPTSWMEEVPGVSTHSKLLKGYRFTDRKRMETVAGDLIPVEDVIRMQYADPASQCKGSAPLDACEHDIQLDAEQYDFLKELLINYQMPALDVAVKGKLTPSQKESLSAEITDAVGKGMRGAAFVHGDHIVATANKPVTDLDWPGFFAQIETRICGAFLVPPILANTRAGLDRSTYNNVKEMRSIFYSNAMVPFWDDMAEDLTHGLLRMEGENSLSFRFDYSQIPELREDADARGARAVKLWESGLVTRDEARVMCGLERMPEATAAGDVLLRRIGVTEVPADATREPMVPVVQPGKHVHSWDEL